MKPFLLITTRDLEVAALGEHDAIARSAGLEPEQLVQWRADRGPLPEVDPAGFSGVFLGGSPFNTSDFEKSPAQMQAEADLGRLAELAVDGRLPMLGLCYGMGILAQRFGGTMDREHGEEAGAVEVELTEDGRRDPIFGELPDRFMVCTGHKEACSTPPPGSAVLMENAACPVQAIRVGEAAYATQFHAELDPDRMIDRMTLYRDYGYFPSHELDAIGARIRAAGIEEWPERIMTGFVARYAR